VVVLLQAYRRMPTHLLLVLKAHRQQAVVSMVQMPQSHNAQNSRYLHGPHSVAGDACPHITTTTSASSPPPPVDPLWLCLCLQGALTSFDPFNPTGLSTGPGSSTVTGQGSTGGAWVKYSDFAEKLPAQTIALPGSFYQVTINK
jgi:hypothetical protein